MAKPPAGQGGNGALVSRLKEKLEKLSGDRSGSLTVPADRKKQVNFPCSNPMYLYPGVIRNNVVQYLLNETGKKINFI